jgi:hypothetical protein
MIACAVVLPAGEASVYETWIVSPGSTKSVPLLFPVPAMVESVSVPVNSGAVPVSVTTSLSEVPALVTVTVSGEVAFASTTEITAEDAGQSSYEYRSNDTWPTCPPPPHDAAACEAV